MCPQGNWLDSDLEKKKQQSGNESSSQSNCPNEFVFFLDHAQSIPCPFDQSWYFKRTHQICQPKAFDHCSTIETFRISYHEQCQINQGRFSFIHRSSKHISILDFLATCFAQFSDGNRHYIISRTIDQKRFICFVSVHLFERERKNEVQYAFT